MTAKQVCYKKQNMDTHRRQCIKIKTPMKQIYSQDLCPLRDSVWPCHVNSTVRRRHRKQQNRRGNGNKLTEKERCVNDE